jgi:hypothetical protein
MENIEVGRYVFVVRGLGSIGSCLEVVGIEKLLEQKAFLANHSQSTLYSHRGLSRSLMMNGDGFEGVE